MPLFMRTRRIMKEKVLTTVVTFETTTQAIAMERECKKNKFTGRLIPVPREISASCGLAWKCGEQNEEETASYMKDRIWNMKRFIGFLRKMERFIGIPDIW